MTASVRKIQARAFKELLTQEKGVEILDVREAAEFRSEKIKGSKNMPLSSLKENAAAVPPGKAVYLLCNSGNRACQAAEKLSQRGHHQAFVIDGGLEACKREGVPVESGDIKVWALDRQVRLAAGALVLLGIFLSWLVHPFFIGLSAFVGAGLVFSGATNTCGMAMLLAKMPWNQVSAANCKVQK